jgi:hypothetical protein
MKYTSVSRVIVILICILIQSDSKAQILANGDAAFWFSGNPNSVRAFQADSWGNTFTSMSTNGSIETADGAVIPGNGAFVKHNKHGDFEWANTGMSYSDIRIDDINSIFVSGYHSTGGLPAYINVNSDYNFTDFVAKLLPNGDYDWIVKFPGLPRIYEMNNGNLAFAVIFDPSNGNNFGYLGTELLQPGGPRLIYGELDANGNVLWRNINQSIASNFTIDGCAQNNGKFYFHGYYRDDMDFGSINLDLGNLCTNGGWTSYQEVDSYLAEVDMAAQDFSAVIKLEQLRIRDMSFDNNNRIYFGVHHNWYTCQDQAIVQGHVIPSPVAREAYIIRLNEDLSYSGMHDICGPSTTDDALLYIQDIEVRDDRVFAIGVLGGNGTQMSFYPGGTNIATSPSIYVLGVDSNMDYYHSSIIPQTNPMPLTVDSEMFMDSYSDHVTILAEADSPSNPMGQNSNMHFIGSYLSNPNEISGRAYKDMNQSGTYDAGDIPIAGSVVESIPPSYMSVTLPNGMYQMFVDTGQYELQIPTVPTYYTRQPTSAVLDFPGYGISTVQDLTLIPVPGGNDIRVNLIELAPVVVSDIARCKILVTNDGTFAENGTVKLYPLNYSLPIGQTTTSPVMYQGAGFLGYDFTNLTPGDTFSIEVSNQVPISFLQILNQTSLTTAEVTIQSTDVDTTNNTSFIYATVLSGYDPNIKRVDRKDSINVNSLSSFEYLYYTVYFQNEGNYPAENIIVNDEISNHLNLSSFELIDYSHDMVVEIDDRQVSFLFEEIFLPSVSADSLGSIGHIHYRIKKNNNLIVGDTILNQAYIYFDQNPAIITNFTSNYIVDHLLIKEIDVVSKDLANIYPNPFSNELVVELKEIEDAQIQLLDFYGKVVRQENYTSMQMKVIDLTELVAGPYFLTVQTESGMGVYRVVKK